MFSLELLMNINIHNYFTPTDTTTITNTQAPTYKNDLGREIAGLETVQEMIMKEIDDIQAEAERNTSAQGSMNTLFARLGLLIEKSISDRSKLSQLATTLKTNNDGLSEAILKGTTLADASEAEPLETPDDPTTLPPLPAV